MTRSLVVALPLVCSLVLAPKAADACGNSVERVVNQANEIVRNAEALLAKGQYKKAIEKIRVGYREHVLQFDRYMNLQGRAQRVAAVALVRSKGEVSLGKGIGGNTDAQRRAAIAWATLILRHQHAEATTPALTAELAEALAQQPSGRGEAHGLLKDLGERDLMPGAEGWALLALLSKERGDAEGSKKAVERCKQIAAPEVQCEVAETS